MDETPGRDPAGRCSPRAGGIPVSDVEGLRAPSDAELYRLGRIAFQLGEAGFSDDQISAVLALPAFRDLLAAATRDAEKVRRVKAELADISAGRQTLRDRIRRALDGTP